MREDSYTLQEVAELLGVSKRTLQRRLREGAFPGRYLSPGPHGLETRIPAADVRRALDDVREQTRDLQAGRALATRSPAEQPAGLTPSDLEAVRDAVLAITRTERESLMVALHDAVVARDRELTALRGQVSTVQSSIDALRRKVESWMSAQADALGEHAEAIAPPVDLGQAVLAEIDDLLSRLSGGV